MQLADNPITKILREKLQEKNFDNLDKLINEVDRTNEFQLKLGDLLIDFTRQSLDAEIKKDLIELAKKSNILQKIKQISNGKKINFSENRSVDHFKLRQINRQYSQE